ncbi:hypothetical protein COT40_01360 [Candidatus Peregrinibacteria bacterium CG08_land_8_20_14_0_20_41_10]|nr:MAG: hypothetical protein AUJ78_01080 [Candidatus Peregrinibacteria bacterium CG1_02_41_10]PIS32187.1 MAG: hypothetical protein COT40_01360 [Candidatus Peregrinibacteria bacterium CG08_land_8_20_14_0_20_41_10]
MFKNKTIIPVVVILSLSGLLAPVLTRASQWGAWDTFWDNNKCTVPLYRIFHKDDCAPKNPYCQGDACDLGAVKEQIKEGLDANVGIKFSAQETLLGLLVDWTNFILGFLFYTAMTVLLISGVYWITAMGKPEKVKQASKIMLYTAMGILVILLAYAFVSFILLSIGGVPPLSD